MTTGADISVEAGMRIAMTGNSGASTMRDFGGNALDKQVVQERAIAIANSSNATTTPIWPYIRGATVVVPPTAELIIN